MYVYTHTLTRMYTEYSSQHMLAQQSAYAGTPLVSGKADDIPVVNACFPHNNDLRLMVSQLSINNACFPHNNDQIIMYYTPVAYM